MEQQPRIVPGYKIHNDGRYEKVCKGCGNRLMMARLITVGSRWCAFEAKPIEGDTRNYVVHHCANPQTMASRYPSLSQANPVQKRLL